MKLAVDGELKQLAQEEDPRLSDAKAGAVKKILEVGGLEQIFLIYAKKILTNVLLFFSRVDHEETKFRQVFLPRLYIFKLREY